MATISTGCQRRVRSTAAARTARPAIIFADEPTGDLDFRAGAEILQFMRQAVGEMGQTTVTVTHDPVAARYADRIALLADGRMTLLSSGSC